MQPEAFPKGDVLRLLSAVQVQPAGSWVLGLKQLARAMLTTVARSCFLNEV